MALSAPSSAADSTAAMLRARVRRAAELAQGVAGSRSRAGERSPAHYVLPSDTLLPFLAHAMQTHHYVCANAPAYGYSVFWELQGRPD